MIVKLAIQEITGEGFGTITLRIADANDLCARWHNEDQAALWAEFEDKALTDDEVQKIAEASLTLAEMGVAA